MSIKYPKNWFEATRFAKNLNSELIRIKSLPDKIKRNKELLGIMKLSSLVLKSIDAQIAVEKSAKELDNIMKARHVLSTWMQKRKFPIK